MTQASKDLEALRAIASAVLETIEAFGPRGVPSGHLYAALMGIMSLDSYQAIVSALKKTGKITEAHHVLTAKR